MASLCKPGSTRKAKNHRWWLHTNLHPPPANPVGAGLLAKASCQSAEMSTDPALSRASPLPHLSVVIHSSLFDPLRLPMEKPSEAD
ncbi:hypothetical protein C1893_25115 [Pseudomonas sp. MPR-ANC1]|nr:hypothetical protein C1893_25115 [Pseudomonas sp. MPR-ANC1]